MSKIKSTVRPGWAKFCGWLLRRMGWESVGGPMKEKKAIAVDLLTKEKLAVSLKKDGPVRMEIKANSARVWKVKL